MTRKKSFEDIMTYEPDRFNHDIITKDSIVKQLAEINDSLRYYGELVSEEVRSQININEINKRVVEMILTVAGYQVNQLPIEELAAENKFRGYYISPDSGIERILLAQQYLQLGVNKQHTRQFYDAEFAQDHQNMPSSFFPDLASEISHLIEDVLIHEYGHKIYRELCFDKIKTEVVNSGKPCLYLRYLPVFNEGFARWLNYVVAGHEHLFEIGNLTLFTPEQLREMNNKNSYPDGEGIVAAYKLLKSISDKKGIAYVMNNLYEIFLSHFDALYKKHLEESNEMNKEIIISRS